MLSATIFKSIFDFRIFIPNLKYIPLWYPSGTLLCPRNNLTILDLHIWFFFIRLYLLICKKGFSSWSCLGSCYRLHWTIMHFFLSESLPPPKKSTKRLTHVCTRYNCRFPAWHYDRPFLWMIINHGPNCVQPVVPPPQFSNMPILPSFFLAANWQVLF